MEFSRPNEWYDQVSEKFRRTEIAPLKLKFSTPHITLFDVGANRGIWTKAFCDEHPAAIDAHLFEPSAANVADAKSNLAKLDSKNHRFYFNQTAVGSNVGEIEFYSAWEGSFTASAVPGVEQNSTRQTVPITTLDHYCEQANIDRIDFLKLDVEGFELEVLKGSRFLIERGSIERIFFEFSVANTISRIFFRDFWDMLSSDYKFSYLSRPANEKSEASLVAIEGYDNGRWEKFWGTHYFLAEHKTKAPSQP